METKLLSGGIFTDSRGMLQFVNEEVPGNYRRFYIITHPDVAVVRAWQGHLIEEKAFYVLKGSFTIAVVRPNNFLSPANDEIPSFFNLTAQKGDLLRVPAGSFTGIKAILPDSSLLVLSSLTVDGSKKDDYRQPPEKWVDWGMVR